MKPIRYVYIAGAFTKPDPVTNTANAIDAGELVFAAGFYPFIPHFCLYWEARHQRPYQDWMRFDRAWLLRCDALLRLPGESPGADEEVEVAIRHGIPVFYSLEALIAGTPNCACEPGMEFSCDLHAQEAA